MFRNSVKATICIIAIIGILLNITSCQMINDYVLRQIAPLNGDWDYDLTEIYAIERINFLDISLFRKKKNNSERLLESNVFIQEFCTDKNVVCIKYIILNDSDKRDGETNKLRIQNKTVLYDDTFASRYMIYSLKDEKILADHDKKEDLEYFCERNGHMTEFEWISTATMPDGAYYPGME